MSKVLSVNTTSVVHDGEWTGSFGRTGIDKRAFSGSVEFRDNGVIGDLVVDTKRHGGYDKAVYAYAIEDKFWWEEKLTRKISHGGFGENLTTQGIDLNSALIGERWQVGTTILEVSEPRIP